MEKKATDWRNADKSFGLDELCKALAGSLLSVLCLFFFIINPNN